MNDNLKILDLGCGKNKHKDATIGVDNVKLDSVDLVWDLARFPYPFEANSVDKIYCCHVLEHFDVSVRNMIINEIHRILKPGSIVEVRVPHAFSIGAFHDPTHRSFFTFNTMDYYTANHAYGYYIKTKFIIMKKWANVCLFYDLFRFTKVKKYINDINSNIFNIVFKISKTLPDLLVKMLPIYTIEILWVLKKE